MSPIFYFLCFSYGSIETDDNCQFLEWKQVAQVEIDQAGA